MELLKITYDRDPFGYGVASRMRLEKLNEVLSSQGLLTVSDDFNYTLNTDLNTSTVIEYARQHLEPDCSFKVVGNLESSELRSGSYYP